MMPATTPSDAWFTLLVTVIPPKTRTGETQVDHQMPIFSHVVFRAAPVAPARFLDQGHTRNFVCRVPRNWGSTTD